jgi:CBS domain-containing protein
MTAKANAKLVASDIMQRDVIVVYDRDTLQEAMDLMTENHVTGLPVVNSKGKCVGVISATDILGYEQEHSEFVADTNDDMALHFDPDSGQWEHVRVSSYALEQFGEVRVEEVMSRNLLFVETNTTLKDVARKMCNDKVHRVLVIDPDYRLQGIITSTDFVKLFAES